MPHSPARPLTLALETATQPGSLAIVRGNVPLIHVALDPALKTTEQFALRIDEALREVQSAPADVGLLAVCLGPGSFTGLRIALTMGKVWAYAQRIPLVAISTLELLAEQVRRSAISHGSAPLVGSSSSSGSSPATSTQPTAAPPAPQTIAVCLDAQRQQWFAATYRNEADRCQLQTGPAVVHPQEWLDAWATTNSLAAVPSAEPSVVVTGGGLKHLSRWTVPPGVLVGPSTLWQPDATLLAQLADEYRLRGELTDPWQVRPLYLRSSAAEERRSS